MNRRITVSRMGPGRRPADGLRVPWLRPIALLLALAAGCRGEPPIRWPFPPVEAGDDQAVLAALNERTRPPESLYAELTMSFQQGERGGVCDAVVRYARPGRMRMTAFKDFLISSRAIFDLLLDGQHGELTLASQGGASKEEKFSGTVGEMARVHPGFRIFPVLREAFFLPGVLPNGAAQLPRVERTADEILVHDRASDGTEVIWGLDRLTLGVRRGEVRLPGEKTPITLGYRSYREVNGRFFPERFEMVDPGAGVKVEGILREIELDVPLDDLADRTDPRGASLER